MIPLATLAFLRITHEEKSAAGWDPIDEFLPFVTHWLATTETKTVTFTQLRTGIRDEFGINMPSHALQSILRRLAKRDLIKRSGELIQPVTANIKDADLSVRRQEVLRGYSQIAESLRHFAQEEFGLKWNAADADAALSSYLSERTVDILGTFVDGRPLPLADSGRDDRIQFVVHSFVVHAYEAKPDDFQYLESIVKGSFLANALIFPSLDDVRRKFDKVVFYLDTTLLLRALGLAGETHRGAARELLDLLYSNNGRLVCLEHTFDEIQSILTAVRHQLQLGNIQFSYGETVNYLIDHGWTSLDVAAVQGDLEEHLGNIHVVVEPKPLHDADLTIDEGRLATLLDQEVGATGYRNKEARDRDVASLSLIHQLRKGRIPLHIEDCGAVFVTSNVAVARASAQYFREHYQQDGQNPEPGVPLCILEWTLTNLVWLKNPEAAPDLPRKRLIAYCYAGIQPTDAVWRRFVEALSKTWIACGNAVTSLLRTTTSFASTPKPVGNLPSVY